jgi:uncharacterized protein
VKTALLDVNVLIALAWSGHIHHDVAHAWLGARGNARWATTPVTELGFVRLVSNPAFSGDALDPPEALALLQRSFGDPKHEFWADGTDVPSALEDFHSRIQGHRQWTDAYLLSLARSRKGVFATFDRGVRTLAGQPFASALEVIPAR